MVDGFAEQAEDWDWLPKAATEVERYLERMLQEVPIQAHEVTGRAKTIASFLRKQDRKEYKDAKREMTDCVAARVIVYTDRDRDRVAELIRARFHCSEDRNPGEDRAVGEQGYDTLHFVVSGELGARDSATGQVTITQSGSGWIAATGDLARYFREYGGLEIQIRTVASHAWSEFEHAMRYKGQAYAMIDRAAQSRIDTLFRDADAYRKSLDKAFYEIIGALDDAGTADGITEDAEVAEPDVVEARNVTATEIDSSSLGDYLQRRFPDSKAPSPAGLEFGCQILAAIGIGTVEELEETLRAVPTKRVLKLLGGDLPVTSVRRLDDELLVARGEEYIDATEGLGAAPWVESRRKQLRWRHEIIRNKFNVPS